ncbi:hypothetical protein B0H21DRAFT_716685, partial [Amylocystis lapponica]
MQPAASATQQYQLAIPFALAPVSPGLAALHVSRARLLHPSDTSLSDIHCAKCGTLIIHGLGETRSMRSNTRRKATNDEGGARPTRRFLRRACQICGHREDIPLQTSSSPYFPPPRRRKRVLPPSPAVIDGTRVSQDAPQVQSTTTTQRSVPPGPPSTPHALSLSSTATASPFPHPHLPREVVSAASSSTSLPSKAKTKSKKSGLQAMLARNREKQEQEKRQDGQGLSTFLQALQ